MALSLILQSLSPIIRRVNITYTYTLTATDVNGCTEVDEVEIVVVHNPIIDAGEAVTINIGESYTMNTTVESATGNNYNWLPYNSEFMDDNTEQNPTVTPPLTTLYTMYVTNSEGCTSSDTVTIEVYIPPFVSVPNGFTPNNDNENDRLMPFCSIELTSSWNIESTIDRTNLFEFNNYNQLEPMVK